MVSNKIVFILVLGFIATISALPTVVKEDAEKSEVNPTTLRSVNDDQEEEGIVTTEQVVLADDAVVTTVVPIVLKDDIVVDNSVDNVVAIKNVEKVVVIPVEKTSPGAEVVVVQEKVVPEVVVPEEKTSSNVVETEKVPEVVAEAVSAVPLANVVPTIVSSKTKRSPQQWLNYFRRPGQPKGPRRRVSQQQMMIRPRQPVNSHGVHNNNNNNNYYTNGHMGGQSATGNQFGYGAYGGFTGYED